MPIRLYAANIRNNQLIFVTLPLNNVKRGVIRQYSALRATVLQLFFQRVEVAQGGLHDVPGEDYTVEAVAEYGSERLGDVLR